MLPPMVPRLRIARWATCGMAAAITGSFAATMLGTFDIGVARQGADRNRLNRGPLMNDSPGMRGDRRQRSGASCGNSAAAQRLCPPAMTLPSPFAAASASTAASRLVGAT